MAEAKPIKVGTRVEVIGKDVIGKWIGVALDDAKGKNNGTVQGKTYFTCDDNHGIFVRQSQISAIEDGRGSPAPASTQAKTATPSSASGSKIARKSGLRPPSYAGKRTTPKRAPSVPSDLSSVAAGSPASSIPRDSSLPGPVSRLYRGSKESTPESDKSGQGTPKSTSENKKSSIPDLSASSSMLTSSPVIDKMTNLQQQQEMEGLKAEIKDLNEKLDTLKIKRSEDKAKLKEFEKSKIQLQQLQEYKSKMQETQKELQQQLQSAKKAESLQQEVDSLKEKVEELTVDLEILRSEISDKGTEGVAADYQVKQLEQQIERLKDALVKMRDLSNAEKHDSQKLQKENEKFQTEINNLRKDKDRYQSEVTELQSQIIDLKEQVDAALGAEEMVESLTERNLQLEEKIQELEEEKADLETLHEMNEELQENARDTELELREEIDLANAKVVESQRKVDAAHETLADYEGTINKFRELVAHLQDENKDLRGKVETTETKQEAPAIEVFDFKTKFAESKAYAKFEMIEAIDREHVLKSHKAEQCSYGNHVITLLNLLTGVMKQYERLHVHLDETVSLDLLEKSISFFQQLYSVHLSHETVDCTALMTDQVRLVLSACDAVTTDISRLKCLLQIKRRLPQGDGTATPLTFSKEIQAMLVECSKNIIRVAKTLQHTAAGAMQQAALITDTEGLMPKKMEEIAYQASDKVYGKEDNGPYECTRLSFGQVVGTINKIANAMENGEYDFDGTPHKKPVPPVALRASAVKSQFADIETLKYKLETKDADLKELKRQVKLKQEELSEQQVRISRLDKKLENATKDKEENVDKMQRKLDEMDNLLKKKEKEFDKTMDALQADVDTLEQEKQELKERLKVLSKKTLLEGITRQAGQSATSPLSPSIPGGSFGQPAQESSLLLQQASYHMTFRTHCHTTQGNLKNFIYNQIASLKEALNFTKQENIRLQGNKMREQLAKLPPLKVPKKPVGIQSSTGMVKLGDLPETVPGKSDLTSLSKETVQLFNEVNKLCSCPRIVDISKRKPGTEPITESIKPGRELVERTAKLTLLEKKTQDLQVKITNFIAANRTGGQVRTDFSTFPTPQFARVLHEKSAESVLVGKIRVPVKDGSEGEIIPINVTLEQWRHIHSKFVG
ncbi:hypothetical protein KUTeg_005141 [Tegillarca granosa]|uniref:Dynactin subunit 1 n=1 Tax=Tegillarca granosa TaxID=220873 RepID=A0ABQ9FKV4_TEGGR|nr:hypothetical protein KUTeg_005141 [Tegillarca granosa]